MLWGHYRQKKDAKLGQGDLESNLYLAMTLDSCQSPSLCLAYLAGLSWVWNEEILGRHQSFLEKRCGEDVVWETQQNFPWMVLLSPWDKGSQELTTLFVLDPKITTTTPFVSLPAGQEEWDRWTHLLLAGSTSWISACCGNKPGKKKRAVPAHSKCLLRK